MFIDLTILLMQRNSDRSAETFTKQPNAMLKVNWPRGGAGKEVRPRHLDGQRLGRMPENQEINLRRRCVDSGVFAGKLVAMPAFSEHIVSGG